MAEVIWSPQALKDIDEIADYISHNSIQYAQIQTERFFEKANILKKYPHFGRPVSE
ncbi:MAG: type II toxin-antitoxin system RelE/ParE family toxin [Parafilimonas sp.]